MSNTNLHSDECSKALSDSRDQSSFSYIMEPMQYEHKKTTVKYTTKSMGGNVMQDKKRDLVDIESSLRGQTKKLSKCGK
tara:strand:+ start:1029 stop:1265 length:237 start_codon:yes stop_codon:yes gene_type:complete